MLAASTGASPWTNVDGSISADAPRTDARTHAEAFARDGFIGSRQLLTPAQCALIVNHCRLGSAPAPFEWEKGRAVSDRLLYDVATAPAVLALLRPLLGKDILLWAASIIERAPGQIHRAHGHRELGAGWPHRLDLDRNREHLPEVGLGGHLALARLSA